MVKHIILWKIKDDIDNTQKDIIKSKVKAGLEGLKGKIPGLIDIHVQTESLSSSNADLMLDSTFENEEALSRYSVHPEHVKVADNDVRPYMMTRMCLDFEG